MRNQIYHTVGTVPKSNRKILNKLYYDEKKKKKKKKRKIAKGGNINTPNTLIHNRSLSWLGTCT
jgi:hypothetical protein